MKIMAFDLETGGLDETKHSILTAYFAILDENDSVIDELDLKLKPDDGKYVYEQEALDVNGIDIEEHDKVAITYSEAKNIISAFLKKHSPKKRGIRPAGHNIAFDIGFLNAQLQIKSVWEERCHYGVLDTSPFVNMMKVMGFYPDSVGRLTSLVEYYNIPMLKAHTAKDDVLMWIEVFKHIKKSMKGLVSNQSSSSDSELAILEL